MRITFSGVIGRVYSLQKDPQYACTRLTQNKAAAGGKAERGKRKEKQGWKGKEDGKVKGKERAKDSEMLE